MVAGAAGRLLGFELGLPLSGQVLYHLSHTSSPFYFIFQIESHSFQGQVSDCNPSADISHIAGIIVCTIVPDLFVEMGSP
jgi:hypothetical protein